MPKVSIIVPVYKVEDYLEPCINSILAQDYTDWELILVDDGSPDGCGKICDDFASQDPRIQAVHKENGGLSSARNAGLPHVTGEFAFYLDSDDYLERSALQSLMDAQRETGADVVVSDYFYTYSTHEDRAGSTVQQRICLGNEQAMEWHISGRIQNFAWGKLMRSELAKKYLFPEGKLFEDHYWAHFVLADAGNVCLIPECTVHYRQREASISYTMNLKRLDILDGWRSRRAFLTDAYPKLERTFMEKTVVPGFLGLAWLTLTRMKADRRTAMKHLQSFSREQNLAAYAQGTEKQRLAALNKSISLYAMTAMWDKSMKRMKRE